MEQKNKKSLDLYLIFGKNSLNVPNFPKCQIFLDYTRTDNTKWFDTLQHNMQFEYTSTALCKGEDHTITCLMI